LADSNLRDYLTDKSDSFRPVILPVLLRILVRCLRTPGAVYIRGGDIFKLTGIEDGSYDLYFRQGQSWNASLKKFDDEAGQSRMDDPLTFETVRVPEGIRYSMVEITLNEVPGGNTIAIPVDDEEFPDLR
jgi:hypothetical protein